jgi:esterase/lipase superfamily enzyme
LGIAEILMAAPDLDKDHYKSIANKVRAASSGMTLYASSADRALAASKRVAGNVSRAGDVPEVGPVLVDGVDTIDVTAVGAELFGFGHGPFASARSILNDIGLVISTGPVLRANAS